ncbi:MAG: hypothetical protein LIR46_13480 [Bacteroidota bacterium]|nr:hypothetical protein [Bacteroidota bacterium]
MGMAASQARFLGLTARKNNVEYEGQQINQQRTVLSNETANYYNDLLGMSVPVPPSAADYTKTVYSFQDGALTNSISTMIAQPDGKYLISYTSNWIDDFAAVSAASSIVTRIKDESQTSAKANSSAITSGLKKLNATSYTYNDINLSVAEFSVPEDLPEKLKTAGMPAGKYYTYEEDTAGGKVTHYIPADKVEGANYNVKNQGSTQDIYKDGTTYKYGSHALTKKTFTTDNVPDGLTAETEYYTYRDANGDDHYFDAAAVEAGTYDDTTKKLTSAGVSHYLDDKMVNTPVSINDFTLTENYQYNVGAKQFRVLGSELKNTSIRQEDEYYKTLSDDQLKKLIEEETQYIAILNKQYGDDSEWMVRYVQNTSSNTWEPRFVKLNQLGTAIYNENENSLSNIPMYKVGSAQKNEEVKGVEARFEQDSTGRIINVTLRPGKDDEVTYAVSTSTVTDQAKYDDAMNQYEYDKAKYDQAIQETNAKIEIIQAEDKNLELRLKQLDTEQDAISTEMDAVQKIIEKNVESTFKTFG